MCRVAVVAGAAVTASVGGGIEVAGRPAAGLAARPARGYAVCTSIVAASGYGRIRPARGCVRDGILACAAAGGPCRRLEQAAEVSIEPGRVGLPGCQLRRGGDHRGKLHRAVAASHDRFGQRAGQLAQRGRRIAVGGTRNDLGDERIVPGVERLAAFGASVDTDARTRRHHQRRDCAAGRPHGAIQVDSFEVDARLGGRRTRSLGDLSEHVGAAFGNVELKRNQIDAERFFGDRVLDLNARVAFKKRDAICTDQKLHRAETAVACPATEFGGVVEQARAQRLVERRCGRDLDQFLMPPLNAAVALAEGDDHAAAVPCDLDFDVSRRGQELLDVEIAAAERPLGFGRAALESLREFGGGRCHAHSAAAAAGDGFDQNRRPFSQRFKESSCLLERRRSTGSRKERNPAGLGVAASRRLVSKQRKVVCRRAEEDEAGFLAGAGEVGPLGQETVTGMDGIGPGSPGGLDDARDVEVRRRPVAGKLQGTVGRSDVRGCRIVRCVHGDRLDVQLGRRTHDPNGDFPSVGNENS